MALKGNLRDFSTAQLLNLVKLARKTGTLSLESNGQSVRLSFRDGRLVHACAVAQESDLAGVLQHAGRLTAEQARRIRAGSRLNTDKELGVLLVNAGYLSQHDIVESLRQQMIDVIHLVFTWTDGRFHFEANQMPPADRILVPIELDDVIVEGNRRAQEWQRLQDELPDLDAALRFVDDPAGLRHVNLSRDEWKIVPFVNSRTTLREMAGRTGDNEFQIRKIVYGMVGAGLVQVVRVEAAPADPPPGAPARPAAHSHKAAPVKRGIIMRIIDRIRSI